MVDPRTVDHVDIVHRHLARRQFEIHRGRRIECGFISALLQYQIGAVFMQMWMAVARRMRARYHAQATVVRGRWIQRHPDRAVVEWSDGPVVAILVPGGLMTVACRFAKYMATPQ